MQVMAMIDEKVNITAKTNINKSISKPQCEEVSVQVGELL